MRIEEATWRIHGTMVDAWRYGVGEYGKVLFLVVVFYFLLTGCLFVFQRSLTYFPDTSLPSLKRGGVSDMEVVVLHTTDGLELLSWYKAAAPGQPTMVFFQGNAGNIEMRGLKVRPFLDQGIGILLAGYRGYGGNAGTPSEMGLYADGRAALSFLAAQGVERRRIVLYGESIGTGVAVHLAREAAADEPVGGLVLEAPFTALGDVAQHHYFYLPARWLVRDRFESAAKIADVRAPVLIVHGEEDDVVPVKFGRRLFDAALEPKRGLWIEGYGHNDLYVSPVALDVMAFLREFITAE